MPFSNWRFWLALAVSVLLLLLLVYQVRPDEVLTALRGANYLFVAPAIGLYFIAVYFRAVRWRYLLSPLRLFPVVRLYPVIVIGYMANNLLPARLGELVRSYYLARRERFSASAALGTVAVERVYDGVTLLAFAALSAPVLVALGRFGNADGASRTTWFIVAVLTVAPFAGALAFLTLLVVKPGLAEGILRLVPPRFRPGARTLLQTFVQGLSILRSPRQHLALFLLSLPVWLMEGATYYLIGYSFGIDQFFATVGEFALAVILLTATSNLATVVPAAIGGIGPFEIVGQQTLAGLGVDATVAGAYAAFVHLVALWLPVNLAGLALAWQQNLSLRQLAGFRRPTEAEAAVGYLAGVPEAKGDLT